MLAGYSAAALEHFSNSLSPYYSDELCTLYHGDALEVLWGLPAESIGLIVTSPPFNLGKDYDGPNDDLAQMSYETWLFSMLGRCQRLLEAGGRLAVNLPLDVNLSFTDGKRVKGKYPSLLSTNSLRRSWLYNTTILWLERNISKRTAWGSWMSASNPWVNTAAEVIQVWSKTQRQRSRKGTSTIGRDEFIDWTLGLWDFPGESAKRIGHPAPFPEELPYRLIQLFSYQEDTILDPFVGSGTTCVVAKRLGRKSIGIDSNSDYLDKAIARLKEAPAHAADE